MTGLKISQLPAVVTPLLSDLIPAVQAGVTNKETWSQVLALFAANATGTWNISITGNAATVTTNANLTGDVTSIGNATTISANAVTTSKINNAAVTYAKIQNEGATTLLGNPTGGPASPSEITLGATLAFVSTALRTIAMTGDVTTAANSFATTIATNAVTYSKFQQVAANSLVGNPTGILANAQEITLGATLAFVASALQTLALTGDVTSSANSFVTAIAVDAITTAKIANGAVTYAKIQNESALTLLGNPSGGAAAPSEVVLGATLAFVATALQTLALSGDVTSAANSFVTTIANNAVTYAKMQQVASNSIIGNPTGATATPQAISLGATLAFVAGQLRTIALSGDVSSAANSFATTIAAHAVTYAKFQQAAASTLIGNPNGVLADVEAISIGSTLAFVTSTLQTIAMTGDVTTAANSFATTLANNAVTTAKIANGAVTYAKIQNEGATTFLGNPTGAPAAPSEISLGVTLAFVGSALQTLALTGDVTASANSFVTTIANDAVTTAKINNSAVTYAKIQNVAAFSVIGNNTGAPAAATDVLISALTPTVGAHSLLGNPTGAPATASDVSIGATLAFVASALQTLAITGDVTSSANSFVTTIANNAVTTAKINNAAVTYAKIQNESAATLLGNPTGGVTSPSEITLGATLSFVTSALQTLALTGDVTSSANSFVTTIANNAVTTAKINNAAVTYAKIQNESASTLLGNPTGGSTSPSEITLGATLAFVASALQTLALSGDVTTAANSFVTTIANNAVTTAKINNAAVTYAKIQNAAATTLIGNPTGGSTSVSEITLGATLAFVGSALQTLALSGDVTTSANSFVTTIANNAITTAKINNAAVTYAKIQNVAANSVVGNSTSSSATATDILISSLKGGSGNLIIGGEFGTNPWQRGTSFTTPTGYTADRWFITKSGGFTYSVTQDSNAPSVAVAGVKTTDSYKMAFSNTVSPGSADVLGICQFIEGYRFSTVAQKTFTLSFSVYASMTGTYCVAFINSGQDRSYVAEYTVNSANTWEYKTITVTASPSAGTWNYTTGVGLEVFFTMASGSNYQTTANSWQTGFFVATPNQVTATTSGGTFYLDCVKIEDGSTATPYQIDSYSQILNDCYRYYYTSYPIGSYAGSIIDNGFEFSAVTFTTAGGSFMRSTTYQQSQRTAATVTLYSPRSGSSGVYYDYNSGTDKGGTADFITTKGFLLRAAGVVVNPYPGFHYTADAEL